MLSPVESLPVELFDIISDEFSIPDCQSLRLTSRQLHRLIHAKFVRLAFCERRTTLSLSSLNRLINVSSHRDFRDAVKCLHIRLLNHHEYANLNAISRAGRFPPPKRFPRVSGIKDRHISDEAATYAYVIQNERPARLYTGLLKAMESLPQLKIIRFSMKQSASSISEHDETLYDSFRNRCFEAVVFAMSHSKIKLEEFSMGRKKGRKIMYKQLDLSFLVFQLAPASLQALQYCFSNLQSLTLSIMISYNIPHPNSWAKSICDFINTAPRLTKLTLSLDRVANNSLIAFYEYSCVMHRNVDVIVIVIVIRTTNRIAALSTIKLRSISSSQASQYLDQVESSEDF
ncbi:hypothetical protein yc1106_05798 [Curvularia clavata]|uniref:F-box domain-containing protein n=1 Tax=Curvularia clavata TaxID=95742 RepID=A0A9Q8Z9J4_CURCL|nr:hypothetical protein yc1106_05798 [Curvularia clavata]